MKRVDELRNFRERPAVIWLEFIRVYRPGTMDVYAFFEGRDDQAFFLPELRRRRHGKGDVLTFRCNGKSGVLAMLSNVIRRVDHSWRALFFVDKDLDDILGFPRPSLPCLFETDVYSIENYLVTTDTLQIVWTDIFKLSLTDPRLHGIRKEFETAHNSFSRRAICIMAWVLACRRTSDCRPNLENASMKWVFGTQTSGLPLRRRRPLARELEARCQVGQISWRRCRAAWRDLRTLHPKVFLRGRWELWFFVDFCRRVRDRLVESGQDDRPDAGVDLAEGNAIEMLSARLRYPDRLMTFLDRILPAA